ncbi:MAG: hypothetical protein QW607_05910 [Desulfurococcaceae archaeon]
MISKRSAIRYDKSVLFFTALEKSIIGYFFGESLATSPHFFV